MTTTEGDAYFAGIFDGEGYIGINKAKPSQKFYRHSPRYCLKIVIVNSNEEVLRACQKHFGVGSIYSKTKYKDHHSQTWGFELNGGKCAEFLERVYPFLIVKKAQAELAFEFLKVSTRVAFGLRTPTELTAKREAFFQELKLLKHSPRSSHSLQVPCG